MIIAFALYKYFPFGGLQRDFLRIAKTCQARGYSIRVYALSWQGEVPEGFDLVLLPKKGLSSQAKYQNFSAALDRHRKRHPADLLVGFNKMPGLDVYYAADGCYEQRIRELYRGWRGFIYRLGGRYRHFSRYETAVFGAGEKAQILMISELQQRVFERIYQTESARLHMLPPGISRDRRAPSNAAEIRAQFRREFNIADDEFLLLMVGSGFKTKGLDRSITALAELPPALREKTHLFVLGQDNPDTFELQAKLAGVDQRLTIFPGRDDVPRFLLGADLLLHPARHENTGTVLLEAVVAGLPVICTPVCGYARYIDAAKAGRVLCSEQFSQAEFNTAIASFLKDDQARSQMAKSALVFADSADIYSMSECAADLIESQLKRPRQ